MELNAGDFHLCNKENASKKELLASKGRTMGLPSSPPRRQSTPMHPLLQGPQMLSTRRAMPLRSASKSCLTEFTQRVMSGKLLQLKQFQNQLTEAQNQLQIVVEENRGLTRLIKRQEISLRRYEGENAGMPRLIRAHADEIRVLRSNVRQLKHELRDSQAQLREKEAEVLSLKDTIVKLRALAEEKKVFDQEKSDKKIQELQGLVDEQNREIQMLSRRILLESKNHQRLVTCEEKKHRDTRRTLNDALVEIKKLENEKRALILAHRTVRTPSLSHIHSAITDRVEFQHVDDNKLTRMVAQLKSGQDSLPELNFQPHKRQATPTI